MKTNATERMTARQRREQLLELAAEEFATGGLHGASTEALARQAGITQAYVFRLFGTKKALFLLVVRRAFERLIEGMDLAANQAGSDRDSLAAMGRLYDRALDDRTGLLVQLQAFAASGDPEIRDVVREEMARMWAVTAEHTALPRVAVKTFLAYGMLLTVAAAVQIDEVDARWERGIRTHIHAGLFDHLTEENNQ